MSMRMRKINAWAVVKTLIAAEKTGFDAPLLEVEAAYECGADLELVSTAMRKACQENRQVSFPDLVQADLDAAEQHSEE